MVVSLPEEVFDNGVSVSHEREELSTKSKM
jgi:hypothetical protein